MYYFIINPKSRSGRGKTIWTLVRSRLDELQIQYKYYFTRHKFHATELASMICSYVSGSKNIVVLGGDGTINEVINGITDFEHVCLSYIPSGSSNDFAKSLHIPHNPEEALAIALAPPQQTTVDVGELEVLNNEGAINSTRKFAVSCGIGYDATICYEALNSRLKNTLNCLGLGKLTYGLIAAKLSVCYPSVSAKLVVNGKERGNYNNILFLVSMVHPYEGGGAKLAPNANYSDKKLSVCFVHDIPRWKLLLLLPTAFIARHTTLKGVDIFDCDTLELIQEDSRVTHTDGEYGGTNRHIRLFCNRHTLTVNTPL